MPRDVVKLDPTSLRGLAHPLRVRLLGVLREHGPATATQLAERLGQSSGATSYHLRQLAAHGFIVEETGRGVGRERWWRAAHRTTTLEDPGPQGWADAETYMRAVATQYAERVDRFITELPSLPRDWQECVTVSDWRLRLTAGEAKELHDALFSLIARYRRADDPDAATDAPPDAAHVVVQAQIMPFLEAAGEGSGR
ncbi:MAG TPA: helix-turn-helix domain-containing protein [Micromonosporaceae bacterium]|jgi:DNA-binding transcriptional ArsR family regulator